MLLPDPSVTIRGRKSVSDAFLREFMDGLARNLGLSIAVHSGDRDHRPKGSPSRSLHLAHRAADFHIRGMSDERGFAFLWQHRKSLPMSEIDRYQIIHHGKFTATEGEHLHVGHYQMIKAYAAGPGVTFWTEGRTVGSKGHYQPYNG